MVKYGCLLALCHLREAWRVHPAAAVLAEDAGDPSSFSDGYLCLDGQGQPGQNYAVFSGSRAECRGKCDEDAACMGFEFAPCKLFGANAPRLGANGTQYCLRTNFSGAAARAVPGDGDFAPSGGWLAEILQVPVSDGDCKELGGGGSKGASGAQFFACGVEYGGSAVYPELGLPTQLFVKVRTPEMMPNEFDVERQIYALAHSLPDKLPIPEMLSGSRNHLALESAGSAIDADHEFTGAEVKAILDAYATFHSSFWNISMEGLQLKSVREWAQIFGGVVSFPPAEVAKLMMLAQLPEDVQELVVRLGTEVGYMECLQYMLASGHTIVQGDAHYGQILRVSDSDDDHEDEDEDEDDDDKDGGTWNLADFGWAHANHPAVDIGSILAKIGDKKDQEEHLKHYWEKFTESVGCDNLPSCELEEFAVLFKLGAFFRGTFKLGQYFFEAPGKPAKIEPGFFDDGKVAENLLNWLGVLDSATVDYLSQKIKGQSSSLLSISELPAPNQAVLDALREREFALLAEAVDEPVDKL